jgi:nucleotide sugar dehydrogenase
LVNVSVVGAGKMGLPIAVWIASQGAKVWACDQNAAVVEAIRAGHPAVDEPGIQELLTEALAAGRLLATTDTTKAAVDSDVIIVIVPAVLDADHEADLRSLQAASRDIARGLRPGTLVVYETTVPVGTTRERLIPILRTSGLEPGKEFLVAYSPERIKSRLIMRHLTGTPKVIGGFDDRSAAAAISFYETYLGTSVIDVGTLEAAEFVKLAGMVYRDVNIALANQLAAYAEAIGLDIEPILAASNKDFETVLLTPGIGVGGHCTPVYPYFLLNDAVRRGVDVSLVAGARMVNDLQAGRAVARLDAALDGLAERRVAVLGLGFRPEVKEHVCSPTFLVDTSLRSYGAETRVYDPLYTAAELASHGFTEWRPDDLAAWAPEALVLVTGHNAFADLDLAALRQAGLRAVVDGRRFWEPGRVTGLGLTYVAVGWAERPVAEAAEDYFELPVGASAQAVAGRLNEALMSDTQARSFSFPFTEGLLP